MKRPKETSSVNQICLTGMVTRNPQTKETPAGIPITRFTLEHDSQQQEAGLARQIRFKISVVVSGKEWRQTLQGLGEGSLVRVSGFLNKSVFRGQEVKLVIHANEIEF